MMSSTTSALFLAYISHLPKKRGNRNTKRIQEQLQGLQTEAHTHLQILREGTADILPAWEILNGSISHPYISILHVVGEYPSEEKLYINMTRGKRQTLSFDQLYFDRLSGLKLVVLEAGFSLDIAEQWIFSGHAAVLLLDESIDREAFRTTFYSALMSGKTLEESLHYTAQLLETYIPRHEIPSDPYEYWELKSNRKEGAYHSWGLLYLGSEKKVLNWQWTSPNKLAELPQELPIEEEEVQAQGPGTLLNLRGRGGTLIDARHKEMAALYPEVYRPEIKLETGKRPKSEELEPVAESREQMVNVFELDDTAPKLIAEAEPTNSSPSETVAPEKSDSDTEQEVIEESLETSEIDLSAKEETIEEKELILDDQIEEPEENSSSQDESQPSDLPAEHVSSESNVLDLEADFPPIYIPEPIYLEFAEVYKTDVAHKVEEVIPSPTRPTPAHATSEVALAESIRERELMIHRHDSHTSSPHKEAQRPHAPRQQVSWLAGVWGVGVSMFIALSLLLFVGKDPEVELSQTPNLLETFQQTNKYNVLILPFALHPDCYVEGDAQEEEVKTWLNTLQESEELGLHVAFANGVACPQNAEEAKRIGEVYGAHLVLWGNYGSPSW
ncbi:MAG: hypothetical protein AAFR59_10415, partial [Bacteroidota bacterium]